MIKIIKPTDFKTIPWKNGKGQTTELLINPGGSLADFDWRISIASVVEDGPFSDFSGYWRNLVLIEGNGIRLTHDSHKTDDLVQLLDVATFDGGCQTSGLLDDGPIRDLNVITAIKKYNTRVNTYVTRQTVTLPACEHCFVYCLEGEATLLSSQSQTLPSGHLMHISGLTEQNVNITGQLMIIACLEGAKR